MTDRLHLSFLIIIIIDDVILWLYEPVTFTVQCGSLQWNVKLRINISKSEACKKVESKNLHELLSPLPLPPKARN